MINIMKITVLTSLLIVLTFLSHSAMAQDVAINTDGSSADASAMLDVKSTNKGILVPRLSLSQRNAITSPATGLFIYQTDNTPDFYFYNGSAWVVVGYEAVDINSLSDGKTDGNSIFLGSGAGINNVGTDNKNVAVGDSALYSNTTGSYVTAIGCQALYSNSTGNFNTGSGVQSLKFNTTGHSNTANGYLALYSNTTGYSNTATGQTSLYSNTNGVGNTATGNQALQYNSTEDGITASGFQALHYNTANNNTAIGYQTLKFLDAPNAVLNTAIGALALHYDNNGVQNTAIGYQALYNTSNASYVTAIGYNACLFNDSRFSTAFGSQALYANTFAGYNTAVGYASRAHLYDIYHTTAVGYMARPTSSHTIHIGNSSVQWIGGQVNWSTYSDSRAKENIKEDISGLDFVMKLRPVTWYWDKDKLDAIMGVTDTSDYKGKYNIENVKQSGFLAQEVEQATTQIGFNFSGIHAPKNKKTPYSLSYAVFVVPLVKAVQERKEILTEQQQRIEKLQLTINKRQRLIESFQKQHMVLMKHMKKLEAKSQ